MSASIPRIDYPEIVLGFVSPIGADLNPVMSAFREWFESHHYQVEAIRVTGIFPRLATHIPPGTPLRERPERDRFQSHIAYGNQIRTYFQDDSILAALTIARLVRRRLKVSTEGQEFTRTVYLLNQFKREEEIELLRSVYGQSFFQISVYSRRGARVDYLSRRFANSENQAVSPRFRAAAEDIIQTDEHEDGERHGQRVGRIFHDADMIVSLDDPGQDARVQAKRFCSLLFSDNRVSPTRMEYGMFAAKGAALRTLDLSRQVGAAIFTGGGDIVALGCNDVPRAEGGLYWAGDEFDDREFRRGHDSNDRRKREILAELGAAMGWPGDSDSWLNHPGVRASQFMDALEYGRVVHAEMSAITDAARLGRSLAGSTLYCTTFPCHMCAKHIVAAGIKRVVFLEPYPKSLASELHGDSLRVEDTDRGAYQRFPAVSFEHFHGITPRRYRELFERGRRKAADGSLQTHAGGKPRPVIDIRVPFYMHLERIILEQLSQLPDDVIAEPADIGTGTGTAMAPGTD